MSVPSKKMRVRSSPLLCVRGLSVKYSEAGNSSPALDQIDFDLAGGEVIGVLGESGAGKSTLALSILGLLPSTAQVEGSIVFQGEELCGIGEPRWKSIRGAKIAMIFQEPELSLSPMMRVGDQIAEVLRAHRSMSRKIRRLECEALLRQVGFSGVDRISRAYPHQLSGGELHRVAVAQALACRPDLVIADEATRSLDATTQTQVLPVLHEIVGNFGSSLIFITHNPALLVGFADRVIAIHAGRIVEDGPTAQVAQSPRLCTQRLVQRVPQSRQHTDLGTQRSEPLLEARAVCKQYRQRGALSRKIFAVNALTDVNLEIHAGSITALVGESGSGKSTLASCLAMLESPDRGEIWFEGDEISRWNSRRLATLRPKIQIVLQAAAAALNPGFTAAEIIGEPLEIQHRESGPRLRVRVCELMEEVGLKADWADRLPHKFSGGQRQRLAIARAIALKPACLILDESLSGLDLSTQAQIIDLLLELQKVHSLTYLLISHDLALVGQIADFVAVMHGGEIVERGPRQKVFTNPRHVHTQELLDSARMVESPLAAVQAGR